MKQKNYDDILARQSGMDYSPGIQFQTSLISMDDAKALTMNNQPVKSMNEKKRCRCGSLEHLCITPKEFPVGISYRDAKKGLRDGSFSIRGKEGSKICVRRIIENCFMSEGSLIYDKSDEE